MSGTSWRINQFDLLAPRQAAKRTFSASFEALHRPTFVQFDWRDAGYRRGELHAPGAKISPVDIPHEN